MKNIKIMIVSLLISLSAQAGKNEALSQINLLAKNLKIELQKAMKKSPIKAVKTCNMKAIPLTQALETKDIKIGRTSFKTRNPKNVPQEWMKTYMLEFEKNKSKEPIADIKLSNGKKGLLKPIYINGVCLKCHGGNIEKNLAQKIKKLYPHDKATNYKMNELRGFFWAEYE